MCHDRRGKTHLFDTKTFTAQDLFCTDVEFDTFPLSLHLSLIWASDSPWFFSWSILANQCLHYYTFFYQAHMSYPSFLRWPWKFLVRLVFSSGACYLGLVWRSCRLSEFGSQYKDSDLSLDRYTGMGDVGTTTYHFTKQSSITLYNYVDFRSFSFT